MRSWFALACLGACTFTSVAPTPVYVEPPRVRLASSQLVDPAADARPVPDGPNVVLVIVSSWRPDHLPLWGGPAETGPFLSELAGSGVYAKTTVAAAVSGKGAASALLTGVAPDHAWPVEDPASIERLALSPSLTTTAERLHEAGYSTIGLTSSPHYNVAWGMDQGFEVYFEAPVEAATAERTAGVPADEVVERALSEVKARLDPKRPLYLQLALLDAHEPVEVTDEQADAFAEEALPPRVARYRAALARVDGALKSLINGLESQGMTSENTVVVVVGDHGEALGDGTTAPRGHGDHLGPDVALVPLVARGPGVGQGVIEGLVSTADVPLALLPLAGVEGPESGLAPLLAAGNARSQRPFAPVVTTDAASPRTALYGEQIMCQVDHDAKATARAGAKLPFATGCCAWVSDGSCTRPEWDADVIEAVEKRWTSRAAQAKPLQQVQAEPNPVELQQLRIAGDLE